MADVLRWGIAGTGKIAHVLAGAIAASADGQLVAVGSGDPARSARFAAEVGAVRHGTYADVVNDPSVDVLYVATVHPLHRGVAVAAADAGKHILCEKPIAVNERDAVEIVEAARRNDVLLLEAFAYRCHPQTRTLVDLVVAGRIGEVRSVEASFGYDAGGSTKNYLFVRELAGGGILDVGCYPTSIAHLVAAATAGARSVDATEVSGIGDLGPTGVDLRADAKIVFEGGLVATAACSIQQDLENAVVIEGSEGHIRVPSPWLPGRIGTEARIEVEHHVGEAETFEVPLEADIYTLEVEAVHASIRAGTRSTPMMPWEDSLANMRTLDRWRAAIGLRFDDDVSHPRG